MLLRDFRSSDRSALLALAHDEAMFEYMKFRLDEATAARWLGNFVNEPNASPRSLWSLVIESPESEFAGWAGLDGRTEDDEAEIGWYLASRHWGRGYATEATRLLIDFACDTLGYHTGSSPLPIPRTLHHGGFSRRAGSATSALSRLCQPGEARALASSMSWCAAAPKCRSRALASASG